MGALQPCVLAKGRDLTGKVNRASSFLAEQALEGPLGVQFVGQLIDWIEMVPGWFLHCRSSCCRDGEHCGWQVESLGRLQEGGGVTR